MSDYKAFRCPACNELVNNTMSVCKHCSAALDEGTIAASVSKQERINSAYNAANNVRLLAGVMWVAFFFGLLPFVGLIGRVGFYLAFIGVPVYLIIWLIRYGSVDRSAPDMDGVGKKLLTALGLWALYPVLVVVFIFLVFVGAVAYEAAR